jgi:hypothetical protein
VQGLNHQRRQATHHHGRKIGVHFPHHRLGAEQAWVSHRRFEGLQRRRCTRDVLKAFANDFKSQGFKNGMELCDHAEILRVSAN